MKHHILAVLMCVPFLLGSCRSKPACPAPSESALSRLTAIVVEDEDWDSANAQVREVIGNVSSASELKELYYKCRSFEKENYVGEAAPFHIHYRLVDLGTDDGAKALVDIFADEDLEWYCPLHFSLFSAITRCGKRAQPYLAKLMAPESKGSLSEDRRGMIPFLISNIEKGHYYGPGMDVIIAERYGVPIDVADARRRFETQ